jgi:hypothetical protein
MVKKKVGPTSPAFFFGLNFAFQASSCLFGLNRKIHGLRGYLDILPLAKSFERFATDEVAGIAPVVGIDNIAQGKFQPVVTDLPEDTMFE